MTTPVGQATRLLGDVTFGALLGAGIAGVLFLAFEQPPGLFYAWAATGGLLGGALQRPISKIWDTVLQPVASMSTTLIQCRKIGYYFARGFLTPEDCQRFLTEVIERDILESSHPAVRSTSHGRIEPG